MRHLRKNEASAATFLPKDADTAGGTYRSNTCRVMLFFYFDVFFYTLLPGSLQILIKFEIVKLPFVASGQTC